MNNNYLILGLVLFFGILYYCFSSSLSVTENFQGQAVYNGQDDINAINTLAQLARQLMTSTGAVTVPGSLAIQGNLNVNGEIGDTTIGRAVIRRGTASPDWTKIQFGDGSGWRIRFQRNDANPVMDIYDNGALNTTGTISTNGYLFAGPTSSTNQVRVGELYGKSGVYAVNSELNLAASNSKVYIGSSSGITNDLMVTGNLNIKNMQITPVIFSIKCPWGNVSTRPYLQVSTATAGASVIMSNTNTNSRQQWFFNGQFIMNVANNECLAINGDSNYSTIITVPPTPGNIDKCVTFARGTPNGWCGATWCAFLSQKLLCMKNNQVIVAKEDRTTYSFDQNCGDNAMWQIY